MIKIETQTETANRIILRVEGRLTGAFVPELENCWKAARASQPERRISIDLKDVTCIDRVGRYLLELMHRNGVGFLPASLAIQDILEQITENQGCR